MSGLAAAFADWVDVAFFFGEVLLNFDKVRSCFYIVARSDKAVKTGDIWTLFVFAPVCRLSGINNPWSRKQQQ
jgi:hypothetical protein